MRSGNRPSNRFPSKRIAPLLQQHIERTSFTRTAELAGLSHRSLVDILTGEQEWVLLGTADRIVCRLGRPDYLHIELGDLYAA